MQDIHAIGGGGGRFYGGGDRRLRPNNHLNHQSLKCPRCDSLNTKFCYYNNYNLSQPRHFCKNCRRYWTKGGVLRNVPVGGGCRKTKRSKQKTTSNSTGNEAQREGGSNAPPQSSSSESSSLTATTIAGTPTSAAVAEEATKTISAAAYGFPDAGFFNANPNLDHNIQSVGNRLTAEGQIFAAEISSFTSLMESSSADMLGFSVTDIPTTSFGTRHAQQEDGAPATVEDFKMRNDDGLAAAMDWGGGGSGVDQGLFDLTAAVDPAYWSQPQWIESDQSLNFLLK